MVSYAKHFFLTPTFAYSISTQQELRFNSNQINAMQKLYQIEEFFSPQIFEEPVELNLIDK
ncbi:hypothetical protein DERF_011444 [Dermatophagoides farinae]|uniref:Uncharacterized protein n=1 Tax=Dermatophagoides farinae TaxID=6954 RepID=A0A922HUX3_DERFA|nr:hypothetical protein DERF_011444 [Dermatophagoides farinae]